MTKAEASKLADRVRGYWLGKGAVVDVWVVREGVEEAGRKDEYSIRSNLLNGLPLKQSAALVAHLTPKFMRKH